MSMRKGKPQNKAVKIKKAVRSSSNLIFLRGLQGYQSGFMKDTYGILDQQMKDQCIVFVGRMSIFHECRCCHALTLTDLTKNC